MRNILKFIGGINFEKTIQGGGVCLLHCDVVLRLCGGNAGSE